MSRPRLARVPRYRAIGPVVAVLKLLIITFESDGLARGLEPIGNITLVWSTSASGANLVVHPHTESDDLRPAGPA